MELNMSRRETIRKATKGAMPRSGEVLEVPAEHLKYLRMRPFHFGCNTEIFPPEEYQLLEESGNWLQALAEGKIKPATPEQKHFLKVDREEIEPETLSERAWMRLKGRREF